ncbi:hypothetical protein [Mycobacteroides franklinii]|uniref:hypothetical protein n=1 Tax=Mycobacteroides franklinii TaxID=948102 RepID=UPI00099231AB|nr:hypothetical protein [Mycobacteroides franklinii]
MTTQSSVERIVYDLAADIDLEEIDALLETVRIQLTEPERRSQMWRHEPVQLLTLLEAREAAGINPRGLTWPGLAFEWDTPEDEEVDAA